MCWKDGRTLLNNAFFPIFHFSSQVFTIKEGVQYKIRIDFIVQREIVHGLKYVQKTHRMGVPGTKISSNFRRKKKLLIFLFFDFHLQSIK